MNEDACFLLGHIIKTHGLKGEVKAFLDVDDPGEYKNMESVFIKKDEKLIPFFISQIFLQGSHARIKFEDINSIDEAKNIVGSNLYLPLSELPDLNSNGFYFHEIKGFTVFDQNNIEIGIINDFYLNAGNDLFQIMKGDKEILVPIQDEFILKLNKQEKFIQLNFPEGLLDLYI